MSTYLALGIEIQLDDDFVDSIHSFNATSPDDEYQKYYSLSDFIISKLTNGKLQSILELKKYMDFFSLYNDTIFMGKYIFSINYESGNEYISTINLGDLSTLSFSLDDKFRELGLFSYCPSKLFQLHTKDEYKLEVKHDSNLG